MKMITKPLQLAAGTIGSIATIGAAFWFVEDRYALSSELVQVRSEQRQIADELKQETRQSTRNLRRSIIEDRLFELDLLVEEGKATHTDRARIKRYKRQLEELR